MPISGDICVDFHSLNSVVLPNSSLTGLIPFNLSSDMAARYGGDEFAIILPNTVKDQAVSVSCNLLEAMKSSKFISDENVPITLTASFGLATFPEESDNRAGLIRTADCAMYNVKAAGRAGVIGFVHTQ